MTDFIVTKYGLSINPEILFNDHDIYHMEIRDQKEEGPVKTKNVTHVKNLKFASMDDEMLTFFNKMYPEFIVSIDMKMIGTDPDKYWITTDSLGKYIPLMVETVVGRSINKALVNNIDDDCVAVIIFDIDNIILGTLLDSTDDAVNIKLGKNSLYTIKCDERVVENTLVELKINHMNKDGSVIVRATKPDGSVISIEEFNKCYFTIMKEVEFDGD
jgi:hypothetical protein